MMELVSSSFVDWLMAISAYASRLTIFLGSTLLDLDLAHLFSYCLVNFLLGYFSSRYLCFSVLFSSPTLKLDFLK